MHYLFRIFFLLILLAPHASASDVISGKDIRISADLASFDLPKLTDQEGWAVFDLDASPASGTAHVTGVYIDAETGKFVKEGSFKATLTYVGGWKLVHAFGETGLPGSGHYKWEPTNPDARMAFRKKNWIYNPLDLGGTILAKPNGILNEDDTTTEPFVDTCLIYQNMIPALKLAAAAWKQRADIEETNRERWAEIAKKNDKNVFVTLGEFKEKLAPLPEEEKPDAAALAQSQKGLTLAAVAAVIAADKGLPTEVRCQLLEQLAEKISENKRPWVLAGVIGIEIKDPVDPPCLTAWMAGQTGRVLLNDKTIQAMPEEIRSWLGSLSARHKTNK